ncbi:MAG: hypothetical protein JNM36_15125 [Chitinophagales bacterium]|nr:hypothetical protein [Chitinophagales bacterium]
MFAFGGCGEGIKLIYDPTGQYCISQFRYCGGSTIFTYGKVTTTRTLPRSYIIAHNRWSDAWYGLIEWRGEEAVVHSPYHNFEGVMLDNSTLQLSFMSEHFFYSLFFDEIPNDYIKVSSIPEYNTQRK